MIQGGPKGTKRRVEEKPGSAFEDEITLEFEPRPSADGIEEVWEWDGVARRRVR
jgi:hypothetical protein